MKSTAIFIQKRIDSEVITIPELKELIGKMVQIIVIEKEPVSGKNPWNAFFSGSEQDTVDLEAVEQLREKSKI